MKMCRTLPKVQAILSAIHAPVDIENSTLYSFAAAQGKSTHTMAFSTTGLLNTHVIFVFRRGRPTSPKTHKFK